jgi:aminoglycoside phosphotransferase (APT) family kinase protein
MSVSILSRDDAQQPESRVTRSHSLTKDDLLRIARRLDWRFLLADPNPRRIAFVGVRNRILRDALTEICSQPVFFDWPPQPGEISDSFDLVLVTSSRPEDARNSAHLVAPGGSLRWELRGRLSTSDAEDALRRAHFESVETYWNRPDFENCLEEIPIGTGGILDHVLRGGEHGAAGEIRRAVARLLRKVGWLDTVAPCRSLHAERVAASKGLPGRLRRLAAERGGGSELNATLLLRSPRFRASGHALLFAFAESARDPSVVAKIARLPGPAPSLGREAVALEALMALPGGVEGVPKLLGRTETGGSFAILQTIVPGSPLHPAKVRRQPQQSIAPFLDWIIDLHHRTRVYAMADVWWKESVDRPLKRIEALFAGAPEAKLVQRTRQLIDPVRHSATAWVFEHGDFSAPNLLLDDGRPGVVDWELGSPQGTLGGDAFTLLGFAARARDGALSGREGRDALRRAFFGRSPWASESILHYASSLGVRAAQLPALYVLSWARNVASYIERLDADAGAQSQEAVRSWLLQDFSFAAWEDAVTGFEELRPGGELTEKPL